MSVKFNRWEEEFLFLVQMTENLYWLKWLSNRWYLFHKQSIIILVNHLNHVLEFFVYKNYEKIYIGKRNLFKNYLMVLFDRWKNILSLIYIYLFGNSVFVFYFIFYSKLIYIGHLLFQNFTYSQKTLISGIFGSYNYTKNLI